MESILTLIGVGAIFSAIYLSMRLSFLRSAFMQRMQAYNASMVDLGEVVPFTLRYWEAHFVTPRANWRQRIFGDEEDLIEDLIEEKYLSNEQYRQAVYDYRMTIGKMKRRLWLPLVVLVLVYVMLPKSHSAD